MWPVLKRKLTVCFHPTRIGERGSRHVTNFRSIERERWRIRCSTKRKSVVGLAVHQIIKAMIKFISHAFCLDSVIFTSDIIFHSIRYSYDDQMSSQSSCIRSNPCCRTLTIVCICRPSILARQSCIQLVIEVFDSLTNCLMI